MKAKNNIHIQKASCISAQPTFASNDFFATWPQQKQGDRLPAADPDYKQLIADAGKRRRMGHLIKMGVSTSLACLKNEDGTTTLPHAMMSATGFGGLDDTEKFLRCIIDNDETLLNPSNFIQSTGNTFGGQTGLLLGHHGYNVTYAHGGFSLESALLDAMLQLNDGSATSALVTGADEITSTEYEAMRKMGFWRSGRQMGEGSHSFLLTTAAIPGAMCQLAAVKTMSQLAGNDNLAEEVAAFAISNGLEPNDIDLVLTGCDCHYTALANLQQTALPTLSYKQWCGQYATASGFGLWLGAEMLGRGLAPGSANWEQRQMKNIVVYSEYRQTDYSLMLLKR